MTMRQAFARDRLGMACLLFLLLVLLAGLLAPWLAPHDPLLIDARNKFAPCGPGHWLGTDHLGRDILSRLLYGIRATVGFALLTTAVTVSIGTLLGMTAGFVQGRTEALLLRVCAVALAFPAEVLILALVVLLGPAPEHVFLACILAKWPWYARMIHTITRQYADMPYVCFARVAGYAAPAIIRRHLLPRAAGEIAVLATLDSGSVILLLSALSFLGLNVQPPTPEWGAMLSEARNVMTLHPWQMLPPGLAVLLVTAACNLLGDSLRDALSPRRTSRTR